MKLRLNAHAKINLHLEVGARRKDGYHSLRTLFQEIELHDTLTFSPAPFGIRLTLSSSGLSTGPDNLVAKALTALQSELGIKTGVLVHLNKQIPIGAGLGGGSSDAAAALWGGWILWKGLSLRAYRRGKVPPVLMKLAKGLGADVPFFLKGGRAWATGIGEKLRFLPSHFRQSLVLIYPNVHVSTQEAYRRLDEYRKKGVPRNKHRGYYNSFEPVIMARYPGIRKARELLIQQGAASVMMSGSGSAVFGMVKSRAHGLKIIRKIRRTRWEPFLTKFL